MNFLKNEKGFTLVEVIVVIAIIAVLFITLLPQIDRAIDRARQTGVKTDFRSFQLAAENYIRETNGKDFTIKGFESHLDVGLHLVPDDGKSFATNPGMNSKENDPWGNPYDVHIIPGDKIIAINSFGPNETFDNFSATSDDFYLVTYTDKGVIASCTFGFDQGDALPPLLKEVADANASWHCGKPLDGTEIKQALKERP